MTRKVPTSATKTRTSPSPPSEESHHSLNAEQYEIDKARPKNLSSTRESTPACLAKMRTASAPLASAPANAPAPTLNQEQRAAALLSATEIFKFIIVVLTLLTVVASGTLIYSIRPNGAYGPSIINARTINSSSDPFVSQNSFRNSIRAARENYVDVDTFQSTIARMKKEAFGVVASQVQTVADMHKRLKALEDRFRGSLEPIEDVKPIATVEATPQALGGLPRTVPTNEDLMKRRLETLVQAMAEHIASLSEQMVELKAVQDTHEVSYRKHHLRLEASSRKSNNLGQSSESSDRTPAADDSRPVAKTDRVPVPAHDTDDEETKFAWNDPVLASLCKIERRHGTVSSLLAPHVPVATAKRTADDEAREQRLATSKLRWARQEGMEP